MTRLLIVYHTRSGTHRRLADLAQRSASRRAAEVRVRRVVPVPGQEGRSAIDETPFVSLDDLRWCQAAVFGCPTHYGNPSGSFKAFLDATSPMWLANELRGLVVGVMSSSNSCHGGRDATVLSIQRSVLHWGAVVVPGHRGLGPAALSPYGVSISCDNRLSDDRIADAVDGLLESVLMIASGLNAPVPAGYRPTVAVIADETDPDLDELAGSVADGVRASGGVAVRIGVDAARFPESLEGVDAIAIGSVIRAGLPELPVVRLLHEWGASGKTGPVAGVPATGFVLAHEEGDGAEAGVLALYTSLMHSGAVIVSPGQLDRPVPSGAGNPYGTSSTRGTDALVRRAARQEAEEHMVRLVQVAARLAQQVRA